MKTRLLYLSFVLIFTNIFNLTAQDQLQHPALQIKKPAGPKPWTNRQINDKPGQFQFAIVTDRTGGHRDGIFEKGVEKLNLLQPELVMSVGDLIEGYTTDTLELTRQWDEFDGFVNKLDMPFFYVPGNHDLTNPVMEKVWEKRLGPKNYFFIYKDVLFLAVNSEDQTRGSGKGSISEPQLEWIRQTLADNTNVKWTFLFMHQPLWVQETDPVKWFEVEKLLKARPHTVFAGHRHNYVKYERNNSKYIMLATTGGSTPLRGPELGEFDHFVWVTMTDRGPILANLQLDGVFDEDLRTEARANFTQRILDAEIVRAEPLYVSETTFIHDSVKIRLTNPFDVPVTVTLTTGFSWDMKTDLPKPEVTLAPNSVQYIALDLAARKPINTESLKSVKVKTQISLPDKDNKKIMVPIDFNVVPLKRYELTKTTKPIVIDGKLNDWKLMPYTLPTTEGAKFGITYDENNIYLGVQVNDTDLVAKADQTTFNQDFVGFVIDGQPFSKSAYDKGPEWFANSLYFIASPQDETGKSSTWDMDEYEKGLTWKCIRNEKGYAFEIAIPITYVKKLQGDTWQTVRVNLVVQDKDKNTPNPGRVMWQPNWRENGNIVGSGMFFKK